MKNKFLTWAASHKLLLGGIAIVLAAGTLGAINYSGGVFWPWWLPFPSFNLINNTAENSVPCEATYEKHIHAIPGFIIRGFVIAPEIATGAKIRYQTIAVKIDKAMATYYYPLWKNRSKIITLDTNGYNTLRGAFAFTVGEVNLSGRGGFEELKGLTCLEYLNLSGWYWIGNRNIIGIEYLTSLVQLDLSDNPNIKDISLLGKLTNLEALNLNNTGVKDISALQNLTKLKVLDLSNTAVTDIKPLAKLSDLLELKIYNTPISDFTPLQGLSKLTRIFPEIKDISNEAD